MNSGLSAARSEVDDTTLDVVRRGLTDIATAGLEPDTLFVHPADYEDLVLEKGTDDHYLFMRFPDSSGRFPVWGLRIVESPALEAYRSGDTTPQRVMIIADARRGGTIWDRQRATIEVGYVNDDFIKNKRTIRGEQRVAFGVRRPFAFKYIETVAAVA